MGYHDQDHAVTGQARAAGAWGWPRVHARHCAARLLRNPRHHKPYPTPPYMPAAPTLQLRALERRVLQRELCDRAQVHLIGPVGDAQRACAGPQARERRVAGHARAAVRLHRRVQRRQRGRRRQHLGRRDLAARLRAVPWTRSVPRGPYRAASWRFADWRFSHLCAQACSCSSIVAALPLRDRSGHVAQSASRTSTLCSHSKDT